MKILQINAGLENGGGLFHIINLMSQAKKEDADFTLLTLADGPVRRAARKAGVRVISLKTKSRYDLGALKRLTRLINDGHYDIVHTHGARSNLYVALIRKKVHAKWVITVHSDPYQDFEGRGVLGALFTKLNVNALKKADLLLAITPHFSRLLQQKTGISANRIHVIYNGISFSEDDRIPSRKAHDAFNIINVARSEKIKGQKLLLLALKRLNDPDLQLHFVGDGTELPNLKALTNQLGLQAQVTFHGFLNHQEIDALYREMDLAALTSYSESFPLVLLEAGDRLVPLLTTDVGDMDQMIPDDRHGFVVPVADVPAISHAIAKASALTADERKSMALAEKKYLTAHFSLHQQFKTIWAAYEVCVEADHDRKD